MAAIPTGQQASPLSLCTWPCLICLSENETHPATVSSYSRWQTTTVATTLHVSASHINSGHTMVRPMPCPALGFSPDLAPPAPRTSCYNRSVHHRGDVLAFFGRTLSMTPARHGGRTRQDATLFHRFFHSISATTTRGLEHFCSCSIVQS